MRNFNFDGTDTAAADPRPVIEPESLNNSRTEERLNRESLNRESLNEDTSSLRPIHVEEEDDSNALPKIIGAAVVAVLVVGGGIYAYESSTANQPKQVAMKTPAPAKMAAGEPVAPVPEQNNATPVPNAPASAPEPGPPVKSAGEAPAPLPQAAPVQAATKAPTPGFGIGPTDDPAIDAPMTYTAENAPPPQQPGSAQVAAAPAVTPNASSPNQATAMQQPVAAPNVGNASQPTASVAQLPQRQVQPAIPPAQ